VVVWDLQTRAVAGALAQAGHHQQATAVATTAEQTARSITDPGSQALAAVAGALAQPGDAQGACRVAAAVCLVGGWTAVVELVLLVQPSVSATVADLVADQVTPALVTAACAQTPALRPRPVPRPDIRTLSGDNPAVPHRLLPLVASSMSGSSMSLAGSSPQARRRRCRRRRRVLPSRCAGRAGRAGEISYWVVWARTRSRAARIASS
jgi:hypothetical protein